MSSLHLVTAPSSFSSNVNVLRRTTAIKQQLHHRLSPHVRCIVAKQSQPLRRSANYQPNLWSDEYIQSLTKNYLVKEEDRSRRRDVLTENIREMMCEKKEIKRQLELIDHLQQLGVAYHFKDDIKDALKSIYASLSLSGITMMLQDDLHATSLLFRLLRENGFTVPQDIFNSFRDEQGCFKSSLKDQTTGLLSLYEASYLAKEGEMVLNEAMDFTTKHLQNLMEMEEPDLPPHLKEQVAHALDLPLNWRMQRLQTRWFLEACHKNSTVNPLLLEFAKLDFNTLQDIHKKELSDLSRWWTNLGLPQKLPFFRDRLTENYLWSVGWAYEAEHWSFRDIQTKANCFITMIDDVYDVHGTLDELELFTDAIDRWDVNAIDKLPEYMKICYLAVFNTSNDAAYRVLMEKGLDITPHLKRAWADLCKSYLVEAKWYHQGYTPKLDEYLENAWISISGHVALSHAYCMSTELTKEASENFCKYPEISRPSCMLLRLYDDLATSSAEIERGDVPKSIQCCMHERNVSEAAARQHIKELIKENWRALNGHRAAATPFEEQFKSVAINIPRMAQFIYQHGDGYAEADGETKNQVMSLLIKPID
ncbi:chloroplast terpene synthase [Canna indica]|uniref:Chloroplast terpene synthase n=1 Tax=Canna indica TaxID=4628 RepID=A0AAQ3JL50_9LILI|nr:chloroplast terpene synthase [Canna indica]